MEHNHTIRDRFVELTKKWSHQEAGDLSHWTDMFVEIMKAIQQGSNLKGLDKADFAIDIVQQCADGILKANPGKLPQETMNTINQLLSSEGLNLLKAATSGIKLLLRQIDANNDGQITAEEIQGCFGCCPSSKP